MKILLLLVLSVALLGTAPAQGRDRLVDGFPELPADARSVAERGVACMHFWGEVSGSGDERDRQIAEQLRELRCERIELDLQSVRLRYQDNPEILEVLSEATYD